MNVGQKICKKWQNYKFRLVPWIASDFKYQIDKSQPHETHIDEKFIKASILHFLSELHEAFSTSPGKRLSHEQHVKAKKLMLESLGFSLSCQPSNLGPDAGLGVFIDASKFENVKGGTLVGIYPGTFYNPGDPLFLASLGNPYIFRCADGMLLDGNYKGLSGNIFNSLIYRDSIPHVQFFSADNSWIKCHTKPLNPLSIGQIVNNARIDSDDYLETVFPNVTYQEIFFICPTELPSHLLQYLPYAHYSSQSPNATLLKMVVLIATRDIYKGEELYSSYISLV